MRRFFRELFTPALKCERVGCVLIEREEEGYAYPSESYSGVADRVTATRLECRRCGHTEELTITNRHSLQGLTLDADRWAELRREGYIET